MLPGSDEKLIEILRSGKWAFAPNAQAAIAQRFEDLIHEVMGYQVDDGYQKGHEHGVKVGVQQAQRALSELAGRL